MFLPFLKLCTFHLNKLILQSDHYDSVCVDLLQSCVQIGRWMMTLYSVIISNCGVFLQESEEPLEISESLWNAISLGIDLICSFLSELI